MNIQCKRCGKEFNITEKEQEWYKQKDFDLPKNCPSCRAIRREERNGETQKN